MPWNSSIRAQQEADAAYRDYERKALAKKGAVIASRPPGKKLSKKARKALRAAGHYDGRLHVSLPRKLLRKNGSVDYHLYIASKYWQKRRIQYLKKRGYKCEICTKWTKQVHHLTYKTLGRERDIDLQALCDGCHCNAHEGSVPGVYDPMTTEFMELARSF